MERCLLFKTTWCPHPEAWSPIYIIYDCNPETRQREDEQTVNVSVVMKSLFRSMSLRVHAHFHFSVSSQICYPSGRYSNYHFLSPLGPMLSNKCQGLLWRCALIFQLLWVNRDEQAIELALLNHLIWFRAKFQRLRHKHESYRLWKLPALAGTTG